MYILKLYTHMQVFIIKSLDYADCINMILNSNYFFYIFTQYNKWNRVTHLSSIVYCILYIYYTTEGAICAHQIRLFQTIGAEMRCVNISSEISSARATFSRIVEFRIIVVGRSALSKPPPAEFVGILSLDGSG